MNEDHEQDRKKWEETDKEKDQIIDDLSKNL